MARKKSRISQQLRGPSRRRIRSVVRIGAISLLLAGFFSGFVASRWAIGLDRLVQARFEGRLFRVPSRVFSSPTVLYPGLDWRQTSLRTRLLELGYREKATPKALEPGEFYREDSSLHLFRRSFEHPSRAEEARAVILRLDTRRITEIRDLQSGREMAVFQLDPAPIGAYYGPDRAQRELVSLLDVPKHLVDAVLAVEDQRFLEHRGIDLRRILGALWVNLRAREIRQGASTLTQQLAKNFFLSPERSFKRKFQEALMALIIEVRYDKEAILESYLNEIYLGQRGATAVHGVGEAARHYFGKDVEALHLADSALLAAIIQRPNRLSPHHRLEVAKRRRDLVLKLMRSQDRIGDLELERALKRPVELAELRPDLGVARYFLDTLRHQLPDYYALEILATEGLRIYSTLDSRLQQIAARLLSEELARLEQKVPILDSEESYSLQGCLVALRPQTGEIVALVGGRSYASTQFNRCTQARRPAGSVFKPFVYVAALEPVAGIPTVTLAGWLDDSPLEVSSGGLVWRPSNYDRKFYGQVSVRTAFERSLNVATARLGQQVGIKRVVDVARRLGVESNLAAVPSLAIGSADLTPIEIARAYATLANGGIRSEIRSFEDLVDEQGVVLERQGIRFERVLDAGTAFLATQLLQGAVDRGTGVGIRRLGLKGPIAGKTGTSDEERDAWFAGYTPELVVVVWVGFDKPRSLGLPASQVALPIWARFVREATGGVIKGSFPPPEGVMQIDIDPLTGDLALAGCPRRAAEYFLWGTEPERKCGHWQHRERELTPPALGLFKRLFRKWLGGSR